MSTPERPPQEPIHFPEMALLAAIVESSDDAIISKSLTGVIQSWNAAAERIYGYTKEEAVGQPITMLIPADRLPEETLILDKIKRGERIAHFETVRIRKDGSPVLVSLTVSPIRDAAGTIIGASKSARDITERKRIEEDLKSLTLELDSRVSQRTHDFDAEPRSAAWSGDSTQRRGRTGPPVRRDGPARLSCPTVGGLPHETDSGPTRPGNPARPTASRCGSFAQRCHHLHPQSGSPTHPARPPRIWAHHGIDVVDRTNETAARADGADQPERVCGRAQRRTRHPHVPKCA